MRREETSEAAPEAGKQAVGGGCQSGWGRLLSVTNAIEALGVRGTVARHKLGPLPMHPWGGGSGTWAADPTVQRCLTSPPIHTPWEPPDPPVALPLRALTPPPLQAPKSFRTRLGVKIRTGHPPKLKARPPQGSFQERLQEQLLAVGERFQ